MWGVNGAAGPPSSIYGASPHFLPQPRHSTTVLLLIWLLLAITVTNSGGCEFPSHWTGKWFQSGVGILEMNRTWIESKGECYERQGDKYILHDRIENCYHCMVIHEKHPSVLQYKDSYCDRTTSINELCYSITGDAALFSMFRKYPEPKPVQCPFKAAPFTFTYNRGSGECVNPPSRAESCTDDSRLMLKYQACPDVQSTESNVEELVCVATWKEGSTRYLVGKLNQVSRRSALTSDEDQYRCFIYERAAINTATGGNRVTYHVAQSGDATCNGLQSAVEGGSRTIHLTTADSHHGKCRFPSWITDHHTWFSLDHSKVYKFSSRNATLRITTVTSNSASNSNITPSPILSSSSSSSSSNNDGNSIQQPIISSTENDKTGPPTTHRHSHTQQQNSKQQQQQQQQPPPPPPPSSPPPTTTNTEDVEVRVVCHSILRSTNGDTDTNNNKIVQIVAHVTAGCDSGYVCMVFYKRDATIIEIQQSTGLHDNTDDACKYFDFYNTPYITLIAPTLHATKCPHPGKYTTVLTTQTNEFFHNVIVDDSSNIDTGIKKRRRDINNPEPVSIPNDLSTDHQTPPECLSHDYEALAIGCSTNTQDLMEFRSPCPHQPISAYTCHGSWQENNTFYLIASPVARKSTDALRYCFIYTFDGLQQFYTSSSTSNIPNSSGDIVVLSQTVSNMNTGGGNQQRIQHLMSLTPPSGSVMHLSGLADSCHRFIIPGKNGMWTFNFTTIGGCMEKGDTSFATSTLRSHFSLMSYFVVVIFVIVAGFKDLPSLNFDCILFR